MIINEEQINQLMNIKKENVVQTQKILTKALQMQGLSLREVAVLTMIEDHELLQELFDVAKKVKEKIYFKKLVLFAPLYISNLCSNDCAYCAFRASNQELKRRSLSKEEIAHEVKLLVDQGQKRILLVAGESYTRDGFQYILDSIDTAYEVKSQNGQIRRLNVNIAPLTAEDFKKLKAKNIGTYQLFQETYHRDTYKKVHCGGRKADYDWRVACMDRAMETGIDDVGIGVLFGLADWRFELLALLQHAQYLDNKFEGDSLMLMVSENLKVGLATNHLPLAAVANTLTADNIFAKLKILNNSLIKDFGNTNPRIAVLGLNPHAGDNGLIGKEETDIIVPAINNAKSVGVNAFGPYPADGFFGSGNHKKFDAVLAMYHDQGLIPFKSLSFGEGVNFTAGLNIIRTSPDHGVAYEIAGKNEASESSFRAAIYQACDIYKSRKIDDEINENTLKSTKK